jgi:hypothetical protein
MESVIKNQLVSHLLNNNLITKNQHAFLSNRSTITNLLECSHDWSVSLHHKSSVDVIYIDFSHAFDSVVHSKLLYKLTSLGITGLLLEWINSFLSNRIQCVVLEHCFSDWCPVISGVPQGSVLGPVLFILFINDISSICSGDVNHQLFADDLKLYTNVLSNLDVFSLQNTLNNLQNWCSVWQLEVNISKCYVLHLGKDNFHYSYTYSGINIPTSDVVVDLGIITQDTFKFDLHINSIISKAFSRVGVLFRGFCIRSPNFLKKAFVTYVRPILEYASNVWNPYTLKHINSIEKVQRRFTKRIPSLRHLTYPERLAVLDLDSLELRRLRADLVLYYKILHNIVHIPRHYLPHAPPVPTIHTRSSAPRLSIPDSSSAYIENNFFSRCVRCWNALPESVVMSSSVLNFKRNLNTVDLSSFLHGSVNT